MPIRVFIEGINQEMEFPDGTDDSVIQETIRRESKGIQTDQETEGFFSRIFSAGVETLLPSIPESSIADPMEAETPLPQGLEGIGIPTIESDPLETAKFLGQTALTARFPVGLFTFGAASEAAKAPFDAGMVSPEHEVPVMAAGGAQPGLEELGGEEAVPSTFPTEEVVSGGVGLLTSILAEKGVSKLGKALFPRPGATPTPAEPPTTPAPTPLQDKAQAISSGVDDLAVEASEFNQAAKIAFEESEVIKATGTIRPEMREMFREIESKPHTFLVRVSEADIRGVSNRLVARSRKLRRMQDELAEAGDPLTSNTAKLANERLLEVERELGGIVKKWRQQRFVMGRGVKAFDKPIPDDVIQTLEDVGLLVRGMRRVQPELPLYEALLRDVTRLHKMTGAEHQRAFRNLVDAWRYNLFSATSFTLDTIGNTTELLTQTGGLVARDLYHVVKGKPAFTGMRAIRRAIVGRWKNRGKPLPQNLEEALGFTAYGEALRGGFRSGKGVFTSRTGPVSKAIDYIAGSPLYAKGSIDTLAKRIGASIQVELDALEAGRKLGFRGQNLRNYIDDFWRAIPEDTVARAIERGRKAGFNRPLTDLETRIAGSSLVKIMAPFPRWPMQFTRAVGEWLGIHPRTISMFAGKMSGAEAAEYLGKMATGWGGVYFADKVLFDSIDFKTLEYVHEDGARTRLAARDPAPTALLIAAIKRASYTGEWDKAGQALMYASLPGSALLESGLLGGLIRHTRDVLTRPNADMRRLAREIDRTIQKAIPGQALLSVMEAILNPEFKEGPLGRVPVMSELMPDRIDPTTGEPEVREQQMFGMGPSFQDIGAPLVGAKMDINPVRHMLQYFGLARYRGPRQEIGGEYPADLSREQLREFHRELGKARQQLLAPLTEEFMPLWQGGSFRDLHLYGAYRKRVQSIDAQAMRIARFNMNQRAGATLPLGRRPTGPEKLGPSVRRPGGR